MAKQVIQAPPSSGWNRAQRLARIKTLHGKATTSRTTAETKELIDTLISLLPPDLRSQV